MGAGLTATATATATAAAPAPAPAQGAAGLFARLSIRNKLLVMVLLPLLGVLPLLGAVLLWWGSEALDRLLVTKVRSDLAVAQGYFERVLGEIGASATGVAESAALLQTLQQTPAAAPGLLQQLALREKLDFIRLLPPTDGLQDRTSVEVLEPKAQDLLSPALRQRVPVPLVATRNATPTVRTAEDRAMVLLATRAVRAPGGPLLGHLQAGVLLNRNLPFIDHINQIVYPEGSLPFSEWGSRGTATLFLDDVRISTNVRLFDTADGERDHQAGRESRESGENRDSRAIGTRVSHSVRERVLGSGLTWLDRAFVVNDWYVSAYQPLADSAGQRVGMLYVGVLERPFTLVKYGALASIGALFFAVMILASFVSLRWARGIFRPLEQMEATMQRVEGGALDARVGTVASLDEIGRLAAHLDRLLAVIDENTRHLDAKVAERTRELAAAQKQLVMSEKLATVGQLTASIAHEVNNPIAVIQGNLDLLRELLGPQASAKVAAELTLVDEQIERMRLIVTQLLQFAKPGEFAGYVEAVDTARALEDCLVLAGHQIARSGIAVERDFQARRWPQLNRHELQQVLVNLMVNALHAMPEGGTLSLGTRDAGEDGVEITVTDSGAGLPEELLARLFQPFVTRRPDGTGLGLWISRGLVERYGGDIRAANRSGSVGGIGSSTSGAVFTVSLRVSASP
jgi:signal transduction histidine kinase